MKIAVTGATGLIGWHLCCALTARGDEVVPVGRETLCSPEELADMAASVDAIVHAAGVSRGSDDEVYDTNVDLAERLAASLTSSPNPPVVVFTNSTHIERSTRYGDSKRRAAEVLADSATAGFVDLVLPGVFGEHGRPFSNSVVSTFAHQLAAGLPPTVNDDAEIELIHAQDVADIIIETLAASTTGVLRPAGEVTSVMTLADRMASISERYDSGVIPDLNSAFDRALFNTIRSYRFPHRYPIDLEPRTDHRGHLVELLRVDSGGQSFLSWSKPGITRGNHFHRRKLERFVVVEGAATISLRRLFDTQVVTFEVTGDQPVALDIPTLHTHNISNIGDGELITMFWADELFDPLQPDTVFEEV